MRCTPGYRLALLRNSVVQAGLTHRLVNIGRAMWMHQHRRGNIHGKNFMGHTPHHAVRHRYRSPRTFVYAAQESRSR